jgi:hypothetical protein
MTDSLFDAAGTPAPPTRDGAGAWPTVALRVPPEIRARLRELADQHDRTLTDELRVAVDRHLADPYGRNVLGGLGNGGHHRNTDGSTSRQAARDVRPRTRNQHGRILLALHHNEYGAGIRRYGVAVGFTHEELRAVAGVGQSSIGPRLAELKQAGYIEEDGERKGSLGSAQAVHVLTDKGRAAARVLRAELDQARA